jgi:hypothetical protein
MDNAERESDIARMEAEMIHAETEYFKHRPQLFRTIEKDRIFEAGFKAAWEARAHLTDPGYVRVPVEQLRKLEESRVHLWEFLDARLGDMDKAALHGLTGQIWRVANTKQWDKPMHAATKETSHD